MDASNNEVTLHQDSQTYTNPLGIFTFKFFEGGSLRYIPYSDSPILPRRREILTIR